MKENKEAKPNEDIKYAHFKPYSSKKLVPIGFSCIQTTKELSDPTIQLYGRMRVSQWIYQVCHCRRTGPFALFHIFFIQSSWKGNNYGL